MQGTHFLRATFYTNEFVLVCASRIAAHSASACFLCTMQMIRRRLVVEQDHEPVFVHAFLDRGDHIRRHRYIPPQPLLVRDVRREHADMRDGCTEAWSCKEWGVGLVHTLSFLLYRWPVKGQAVAWQGQ